MCVDNKQLARAWYSVKPTRLVFAHLNASGPRRCKESKDNKLSFALVRAR